MPNYLKKSHIQVVGVMSGTSLDGIDYVLCTYSMKSGKLQYLRHAHFQFEKSLQTQLVLAAQNKLTTYELSELHFNLGRKYARDLKVLKTKAWRFDVVGLHGQTVYHRGEHATWQIGSPHFISQELKVTVVYNFREGDVASGGNGAPLAPFFHGHLLEQLKDKRPLSFHNLGGISNLTYFHAPTGSSKTGSKQGSKQRSKAEPKRHILAFDTGPANMLMDIVVRKHSTKLFDRDGNLAKSGVPSTDLLNEFLCHPFLKKRSPKSCGREEFGEGLIEKYKNKILKLSLEDQLATFLEFTALTIRNAYKEFLPVLPAKIFFSGGGVFNTQLLRRIGFYLPEVEIKTSEDLGWSPATIEGGAFAYLAILRILNQKLEVAKITGGNGPLLIGQIVDP